MSSKPPKTSRGKNRRLSIRSQLRDPIDVNRIARAIAYQVTDKARAAAAAELASTYDPAAAPARWPASKYSESWIDPVPYPPPVVYYSPRPYTELPPPPADPQPPYGSRAYPQSDR